MTLEQQVSSLEISKRLKELGIKSDSQFWWIEMSDMKPVLCSIESKGQLPTYSILDSYNAFTVAELGEMLPVGIYSVKEKEGWYCLSDSEDFEEILEPIHADTEANARGKMLIYLLENKLI